MKRLGIDQGRAGWVQQTFITDDTEAIVGRANQEFIDATARFAKEATKLDKVTVPADQRRQLNLLKLSLVMVTPTGADSIGQRYPAASLTFQRKAFHRSVELSAFRWRHRDHSLGVRDDFCNWLLTAA